MNIIKTDKLTRGLLGLGLLLLAIAVTDGFAQKNKPTNKQADLTAFSILFPRYSQPEQSLKTAPYFFNLTDNRLNKPLPHLNDAEMDRFVTGRSFFSVPWVIAPSATTARDGLGPFYSATTCVACHRGNGMGEKWAANGELSRAMLTKIFPKDPRYGGQIAVHGTRHVLFEALPIRHEQAIQQHYPDGTPYTLLKPTFMLSHENYGALAKNSRLTQRRAPSLTGFALLAKVSDAEILRYADPFDRNQDGIAGRANIVFSSTPLPDYARIGYQAFSLPVVGRYTAKASVETVLLQTAIAAHQDMGLTNPFFPDENCSPVEITCQHARRGRKSPDGETLDLPHHRLHAIADYLKMTQLPSKPLSAVARQGQLYFRKIGCASCHRETMQTVDGTLFAPYSDFLLHDMGDALADGFSAGQADGNAFRTAPLWGISAQRDSLRSKTPYFLHDGRADSIESAILWHGGEAQKSQQQFIHLPADKRAAILEFLNHL